MTNKLSNTILDIINNASFLDFLFSYMLAGMGLDGFGMDLE